MTAAKPRIRDDLGLLDVDGEVVVYDPASGLLHHLNPTAGVVLQLLDGTATIEQTSAELAEAYSLAPSEIESEVRSLVKNFEEAGLLVVKPAAAGNGAHDQADGQDERQRIRMEVPRSD